MDKDTAMEMNLEYRQADAHWASIEDMLRKMENNVPPSLMKELWV